MNVAEDEDGEGATEVVAWAGSTLVDVWDGGTIAGIVAVCTEFNVWGEGADADSEAGATVVVLWPEIVNAATVLSFMIISYT